MTLSAEQATYLNDPNYKSVRDRMLKSHIDIGRYISRFDGAPFSRPVGFNFIPTDAEVLQTVLSQSPLFGRTVFPDIKPHNASFREISQSGSLHIHVGPNGRRSIIHIDSVSIVRKRACDGSIVYVAGAAKLLSHFCTDFMHLQVSDPGRLTLPGDGDGRGGF